MQRAGIHAHREPVAYRAVDLDGHLDGKVVVLAHLAHEQIGYERASGAVALCQLGKVRTGTCGQGAAEGAARIDQLAHLRIEQDHRRRRRWHHAPGMAVEIGQLSFPQRRRRGQCAQDFFLLFQFVIDQQGHGPRRLGHAAVLGLLGVVIDVSHRQCRRDERRNQDGQHKQQETAPGSHRRVLPNGKNKVKRGIIQELTIACRTDERAARGRARPAAWPWPRPSRAPVCCTLV
ncbi:hypothetical protein G4G31_06640 [Massilia sp. Se16.2.3]|nr:hypothetical protein G4G31_06640 [Massilia sp. Se16.2.3]